MTTDVCDDQDAPAKGTIADAASNSHATVMLQWFHGVG